MQPDRPSDADPVMPAAGPTTRRPGEFSTVRGDAPGQDGPALSPGAPDRMHRADADTLAQATSPDFSEHPAHVVTGSLPPTQADIDQGADEIGRDDRSRPPAGGGAAGDR